MISNQIPRHKDVEELLNIIFERLFRTDHACSATHLQHASGKLNACLTSVLQGLTPDAGRVTSEFSKRIRALKQNLVKDARFILESDPAATQLQEVLAVYPGLYAIFCYRTAHEFALAGVPLLPRMITELAHRLTGIDIHPDASIGVPFSIDHGTGIVIGATTIIGKCVKMYQGVTLGALSVEKSKASTKRHPTIEDNVVLYAGSTILGGETVVGHDSIIGGNVWLTDSVAPYSLVFHKSEIVIRDRNSFIPIDNFII